MASNNPYPFMDLLNEDPQIGYYAALYGGGNVPKNQQRHFGGQFNDIYSQYLGTQGQGLKEAQSKGLSLADYLNDDSLQTKFTDYLDQNPFTERYAQLPPELRGQSTSRFAPPVRWI